MPATFAFAGMARSYLKPMRNRYSFVFVYSSVRTASPSGQARIASASRAMTRGRGKLLRQASATIRVGAGSAKGRTVSKSLIWA